MITSLFFCTRKVRKGQVLGTIATQIRSMKNYSEECFRDKLRSANWFEVLDCDDINEAWCKFKSKFLEIVDSVAPIKSVRLKKRNACWFNGVILELIVVEIKLHLSLKLIIHLKLEKNIIC